MIHPLISRGPRKDVQIWFLALGHVAAGAKAPLVMKVFPLSSWIWFGFALMLLGHLVILLLGPGAAGLEKGQSSFIRSIQIAWRFRLVECGSGF